jgi:hypothetical protein
MDSGSIACEAGDVLVLALEGSRRRLKGRLARLGARPNQRMTLAVTWPRIDEGGVAQIRDRLNGHERGGHPPDRTSSGKESAGRKDSQSGMRRLPELRARIQQHHHCFP